MIATICNSKLATTVTVLHIFIGETYTYVACTRAPGVHLEYKRYGYKATEIVEKKHLFAPFDQNFIQTLKRKYQANRSYVQPMAASFLWTIFVAASGQPSDPGGPTREGIDHTSRLASPFSVELGCC